MKNDYSNYVMTRYYIFCALFQTIWSVAVLGFTVFLVLYFNNYWMLFFIAMIFLKPYTVLKWTYESTCTDDKPKPDRKSYGTNNPPQ